jgi:hypothetical protein
MRTRLRFEADGVPRQVVAESGEIELELVDAAPGEDPAEVAAAIRERYARTLFDYANEWPVRIALVRRDGALSHAVRAFCHLASDGMGFALMVDAVFDANRAGLPPPTATDALEQAHWQQTPAGRRQSERAVRHWESLLRAVPARRFAGPVDRGEPRNWRVEFVSPAMHLAMRAAAARGGAPTSSILLAAFAFALTRVTGVHPVVTKVLVSNRFRANLGETVSPVAQHGLLVVDLAGAGFDEVVERVGRAALSAYKHAYYDPAELREMLARLGRERGEEIDIGCLFNDRRIDSRQEAGPAPGVPEIAAARADTSLEWAAPVPGLNERLLVNVNDAPGAVGITALVDTRHLAPDELESLLRGMEDVLVEAATGG